jgi:hypothetical protein
MMMMSSISQMTPEELGRHIVTSPNPFDAKAVAKAWNAFTNPEDVMRVCNVACDTAESEKLKNILYTRNLALIAHGDFKAVLKRLHEYHCDEDEKAAKSANNKKGRT